MSENGEIYTADKNFTLSPAVTALTNITSERGMLALRNEEEYSVRCCLNVYLVELRSNFKEQLNERREGLFRQEIVLTHCLRLTTNRNFGSGYHHW